MKTDADVVVVGAGISGLVAAYRLQQRGHDVHVLELSQRAGGVIGSNRRDDFLYETGPNSTLDSSPVIGPLLSDLGIANERIDVSRAARTRFIVRNGRLVPLPMSPGALIRTPVFSRDAKLRLLREPFIGRGPRDVEESVADFARRRLGPELLDYAVDPFVSGVYAGDPHELSVAASFPRLVAFEQTYGSLLRGMIWGRDNHPANGQRKGTARSFSFRKGMQTLPDALAKSLRRIEFRTRVSRIARNEDGAIVVEAARGPFASTRRTRAVVLAVPAYVAAEMVERVAPKAGAALAAIPYAPITIVARGYRREAIAHSLAGFGFLVPGKERRGILGSLFASSMFESHAPPDKTLITTFAGGWRDQKFAAVSDEYIDWVVREELQELIGAVGEPLSQELYRWPRAIPQYTLGHLDRIRAVETAETELPGVYFCGNYRGGISVGDCIKSSHAMTERVDGWLKNR